MSETTKLSIAFHSKINFVDSSEDPIDISKAISGIVISRKENFTKSLYTIACDLTQKSIARINKENEFLISLKIAEVGTKDEDIWGGASEKRNLVRYVILKLLDMPKIATPHPESETNTSKVIFQAVEENLVTIENKERKSVNYRKTTLKNVVLRILQNKTNDGLKLRGMVMSKIDNEKVYNEIQVTKDYTLKSLKTIDEKYGFYRRGKAHFFIEHGYFYMIDKNGVHDYKDNVKGHTNDIAVVVFDKHDIENNDKLVRLKSDKPTIYHQSRYLINNKSRDFANEFGKKINFYSEEYDTNKTNVSEIPIEIKDKYLTHKPILEEKTVSISQGSMHNPFSRNQFENEIKCELITALFEFKNTSIVDHNFNTQYSINFINKEEKKYNGIYVQKTSEIKFGKNNGVTFGCDVIVELKNISLDVRVSSSLENSGNNTVDQGDS